MSAEEHIKVTGNPREARTYWLQALRLRAGSAATYILIAVEWQTQRALRIVNFRSARELAEALTDANAYESEDQLTTATHALDSDRSSFVIGECVLTGDQLDAIGLKQWE